MPTRAARLLPWIDADPAFKRRVRAPAEADGRPLSRAATPLLSGAFLVRFDDERSAQAAARDCRTTAFEALVGEVDGGWQLSLRRVGHFPADERDRYASRLARIVAVHGGRYDTFVPDAPEQRAAGNHKERAST